MLAFGSPPLAAATDKKADWTVLFDRDWYLKTNPDVAAVRVDPVDHFVRFGAREGRWPNPLFDPGWYAAAYPEVARDNPLEYFFAAGAAAGHSPNLVTDTPYVLREYGIDPGTSNPLDFILANRDRIDRLSVWFSRSGYLKLNPDVAASKDPPEHHYIRVGIAEGRRPGPDFLLEEIQTELKLAISPGDEVGEVRLGQRRFRIARLAVPDTVYAQIRAQGLLDPHVLAPGARSIPRIRRVSSADIWARRRIDFPALMQAVDGVRRAECIVVLPRLQIGGAERYAGQLVRALEAEGRSALVVTTSGMPDEDAAALELDMFKPLRRDGVLSLGPFLSDANADPFLFSMLLMLLRPRHLFVFNSEVAFQAIRQFGRPLTAFTRVHAGFFSEAPEALGAPYSARYLPSILAVGDVLSDNENAVRQLRDRSPVSQRRRFHVLPQPVELPAAEPDVRQSAAARRPEPGMVNVLWASRWEPFKATEIVDAIARKRRNLRIDVYGPMDNSRPRAVRPNLRFCGPYSSLDQIGLAAYDVFLFTSRFEGMPNIVLEIGARGLPIVASDVGGLRETFGPGTIEYVAMDQAAEKVVDDFCAAIDRLAGEPPPNRLRRIKAVREAIGRRHSAEAFRRGLNAMLGNADAG